MMTQKQVLDAVRRLPPHQRQQLGEQIIRQSARSPSFTLVAIKRQPQKKQRRLDFLADKNTEGSLNVAERAELNRLVAEARQLALENAQALVRAQRPELFGVSGKPLKGRVREALRTKARAEGTVRISHNDGK